MRTSLSRLAAALCLSLACGGGDGPGEAADAGPHAPGPDAQVGDNLGQVPDPVLQSGVAYVAHYLSEELRIYRTDGDAPAAVEPLDLGGVAHDLALDPVNDLLVVVQDTTRRAALYRVARPASPDAPVEAPRPAGAISFDSIPVFAAFHPYDERLLVLESPPPPGDGSPIREMLLHVYDVSDPDHPAELSGSPHSIPPTTSFALDAARDVLFVVGVADDHLYGYDLTDGGLVPLPGDPIDLTALYPEDNQFAFQARSLTADMWRHRLIAARSQSELSELIVLEYAADVPRGGARYGQFAGMDDIRVIADPFDVALPPDQRPNLLDAFQLALDPATGAVFLSANAWNGSASTALVVSFKPGLGALGAGCGDAEGFGCFYRSYAGGEPGGYLRTDGALCADATHRAVIGTTVATNEEDPGSVVFFRYQPDLAMTPWLPQDGGNTAAGALPVAAVCH